MATKTHKLYITYPHLRDMLPLPLRQLLADPDLPPQQQLRLLQNSYCDVIAASMFHSMPDLNRGFVEEMQQLRQLLQELAPDHELPSPCPGSEYRKYLHRR